MASNAVFYMPHPYVQRVNSGGNFCGHDPKAPSFTLVRPIKKGRNGVPRVLTLLIERLVSYYGNPRRTIPALDLANGSERQQRSERREACIKLLAAILGRTDQVSLRVGIPTSDGFMNYTVKYLCADTGMGLKRVSRALADLKAADLISVTQARTVDADGNWRGLAAVKAVSKNLFGIFGLGKMLEYSRKIGVKKLKAKAKQWQSKDTNPTKTDKARYVNFMGSLKKKLNPDAPKSRPSVAKKMPGAPPSDINFLKQRSILANRLIQENPDWTADQCYEEAERQLLGALRA